jgi:S-adenosylmethionine uptake transporter
LPDRRQGRQPAAIRRRLPWSGNAKGAALLCLGIFIFTVQDVIIRWLSGGYPVHQVAFIRSLVALPLVVLIVWYQVGLAAIGTRYPVRQVLRGFCFFGSYMTYYVALASVPLAELVAIAFSTPLLIALLSAVFLKERIGLLRIAAILVGFAGVLLVVRPGSEVFDPAALIVLVSVFTYSVGTLLSRTLGQSESGAVMTFYATIVYLGASGGLSLVLFDGVEVAGSHASVAFMARSWAMPTALDLALLAAIGFIFAAGFFCLAEAYRVGESSAVAPFEYTSLLWATLSGFLFFAEVPGPLTFAGMALIVGSGLFIIWREAQLKKAARPRPPATRSRSNSRASGSSA